MSAATSAANGTTNAAKSSSAQANMSSTKSQLKTSTAGKSLDGARKQTASPVDGASSKKAPAPKAWTSGTNPITQRPNATPVPNGVSNGPAKSTNNQNKPLPSLPTESGSADKHANDRLTFLMANFVGLDAVLTLKNGEQFSGIFSGASLEQARPQYTLKMVKRTKSPSNEQANGSIDLSDEFEGSGEEHVLSFDVQDTIDLSVPSVELLSSSPKAQNGAASFFRTDADISGNLAMRERELQRWEPGPDTEVDLSLEESNHSGGWDQFAANEKLYNVRSDYDEDMYTTTINRNDPLYKLREAEAAKIAREILGSAPTDAHVAEERGLKNETDSGLDEEDKYSGVRRDTGNTYVPPARRPLTSQPTVRGAPFDPAIIQMSRPTPPPKSGTDGQGALKKESDIPTIKTPEIPATPKEAEDVKTATSTAIPAIKTSLSSDSTSGGPPTLAAPSPQPKPAPAEGVTQNVEQKVLESFKQFASGEKLRVQERQRNMQDRTRATARQEKSVKLNDLKKFAQNFKLTSRVPDDLVPILAKTKEKQDEIVAKAEKQAREKEIKVKDHPTSPSPAAPHPTSDSKAQHMANDASAAPTSPYRQRPSHTVKTANQPLQSPRPAGMLSHRVAANMNQAQYRPGGPPAHVPSPLPIQDLRIPTGPAAASEGIASPTSSASTRFNVKAMEFRPNPAASTFTPTGPASTGPATSKRTSISTPKTPAAPANFFSSGKKPKPATQRPSLADAFNPIKRMRQDSDQDKFASNGGIPQAYRTPPTWEAPEGNQEKTFSDMFPKVPATPSPMHTPSNGGIMPHAHQLPLHLQNGVPPVPSAAQTPRFYPNQPHHMPNQHFDDHRMGFGSSASSVQPSPRMAHPTMAYNPQMHAQMPHFQPGMPPYGMSPGMAMRPVPGGPYMQQPGPPMGGHMMAQQPSNGPYMQSPMVPHMAMHSPVPGHAQPQFQMYPQQQPGYAASPRAHPMSHQGSQQGHAPPQPYMGGGPMMMGQQYPQMPQMRGGFQQQHFPGAPQPHGYPMQHRAMSGSGYPHQMTPRQQYATPQAGPSPGQMPTQTHGGDEAK